MLVDIELLKALADNTN